MGRVGKWVTEHLVLGVALLVLLYMFVPIFVVVLMSFNDPSSRTSYQFDGFTWENWQDPCGAPAVCESVLTSLQIGLVATAIALVLGTLLAYGLGRYAFRFRDAAADPDAL